MTLDTLVSQIERRWGVDRLPRLVSPATRARFQTMQRLHSREVPSNHSDEKLTVSMIAAWKALEEEATAQGHEQMPPACAELDTRDPKRGVFVVCLDPEHGAVINLRAKYEGRKVETWTLSELLLITEGETPLMCSLLATKDAIPGAELRKSTRKVPKDPIPFGDDQSGFLIPMTEDTDA